MAQLTLALLHIWVKQTYSSRFRFMQLSSRIEETSGLILPTVFFLHTSGIYECLKKRGSK